MAQRDDASGIHFLLTELQTGLVFAEVAQSTQPSEEKRRTNTANARKAHDTFLHFRDRVAPSEEETMKMDALLDKLKAALRDLGERV